MSKLYNDDNWNEIINTLMFSIISDEKISVIFSCKDEKTNYILDSTLSVNTENFEEERFTRLNIYQTYISGKNDCEPGKSLRPFHVRRRCLVTIIVVETTEKELVVKNYGTSKQLEQIIVTIDDIFSYIENEKIKSNDNICINAQWISGKYSDGEGNICFLPMEMKSYIDTKLRNVAFKQNEKQKQKVGMLPIKKYKIQQRLSKYIPLK